MELNGKITFKIASLFWWLYIFFSTLCPNVLLGQISLLLFIITSFKKINLNKLKSYFPFIIAELMFIIYSIWQYFFVSVDKFATKDMLSTLLICFLFNLAFFNYATLNEKEDVFSTYINATFWGLLVTLIFYGSSIGNHSLYEGRLTSAYNINLMVFNVFGHSPTALAAIASNALIMTMITYWKKNKMKALGYASFFSIIILLTQSRKNILYIILAFAVIPYIYSGKGFSRKKIKVLLSIGFFSSLIVVLLINIPILYEKIFSRIIVVVGDIFNLGFNENTIGESSIRTRQGLIDIAKFAVAQKPIWGWGLNNFSSTLNNGGYYAHNNFYEILVGSGVVGFVVFYTKYLIIFKNMISKISKKIPNCLEYRVCLIVFICYVVLEYWQVTYFFRFIYILPLLLFINCKNIKKRDE